MRPQFALEFTDRGRGAFDVIAEFWPHLAMILYRLLPTGEDHTARASNFHALMSRIFLSVAIMEVVGTILETIVVFWLWGSLWDKWTLPFRIVTPILHFLFSCAQGWGAWVFWNLSRKEARKAGHILNAISKQKEDSIPSQDSKGETPPHHVRRRSIAVTDKSKSDGQGQPVVTVLET